MVIIFSIWRNSSREDFYSYHAVWQTELVALLGWAKPFQQELNEIAERVGGFKQAFL